MGTCKHVHDIKQNSHGMTKLLVAIPMSQRIGLAQVSTETSIAQQELIRMAIGSLLAEHGIDGDTQRQHARPTPVTQLTPSVSIVREPVSTPPSRRLSRQPSWSGRTPGRNPPSRLDPLLTTLGSSEGLVVTGGSPARRPASDNPRNHHNHLLQGTWKTSSLCLFPGGAMTMIRLNLNIPQALHDQLKEQQRRRIAP